MLKAISTAVLAILAVGALLAWSRYGRDLEPQRFADEIEHFKYGSIGAEVNGYPYLVWRELPSMFGDNAPQGWATFGFISESGRELPVGLSVRRYGVDRVGFNCATCHTATVDRSPATLLGAPAVALDLQRYLAFLAETAGSPNFTADEVFASAVRNGRPFGLLDKVAYRFYVIPEIKEQLSDYLEREGAWMKSRAPHGPGRTDAGNPWRQRFGMHPEKDDLSGAVDMPSLWNQRIRQQAWLHWDGNNRSLAERNLSAALAGGASESSLDHPSIERVAAWALDAQAPPFPFTIDTTLATRGRAVYEREKCGDCHDPSGSHFGGVTPNDVLGADSDRLDLFSAEMVANFGGVGRGSSSITRRNSRR